MNNIYTFDETLKDQGCFAGIIDWDPDVYIIGYRRSEHFEYSPKNSSRYKKQISYLFHTPYNGMYSQFPVSENPQIQRHTPPLSIMIYNYETSQLIVSDNTWVRDFKWEISQDNRQSWQNFEMQDMNTAFDRTYLRITVNSSLTDNITIKPLLTEVRQ